MLLDTHALVWFLDNGGTAIFILVRYSQLGASQSCKNTRMRALIGEE
jgi:hypothetical protein